MFEAILCVQRMQADIDQLCSDWPLTENLHCFPTEINDIRRKLIRKLSLETSQTGAHFYT